MILSDTAILDHIATGAIKIRPFVESCLGSNSYDVHLGEMVGEYEDIILDAKKHNKIKKYKIPADGMILEPHKLYLAVTKEYTETHEHVPMLEGKSSTGRLGIDIHATAGKGDVGFCGFWTLEISVKLPVRVYVGMPIGQLIYHSVEGKIKNSYINKSSAKYINDLAEPVESMMFKNVF